MKKLILYLTFSLICLNIYGQKEDSNWLLGSGTLNKISFTTFGYSIDTFVTDPYLYILITNSSISDSSGNLTLYTGGADIYKYPGGIIENGDSINPGWIRDSGNPFGSYTAKNGAIFLNISNNKVIYLFHLRGDTISDLDSSVHNGFGTNIFYSKIVKDNVGNYVVDKKNVSIIEDTLTDNGVAACRHGNGQDWWIMASEGGNNCYYTMIYSPDTIEVIHKQCIGGKSLYLDGGQSLFSPDGSKFIRGSTAEGVEIFDFDRCSGLLSNAKHIPLSALDTSIVNNNEYSGSVAVSPNNRFLYVATSGRLFQFDLQAADIVASKLLIHNRDTAPNLDRLFLTMQLAPNGEIFVGNGSWNNEIHIIHNPDEMGTACNFEVKIPMLANGSDGLPNFPNYRLGALEGSPCDTLRDTTGLATRDLDIQLNVHPNPASNYVEVDYGYLPWQSNSNASLKLINALGEVVYSQKLPSYSAIQFINVKDLPAGFYVVAVWDNGKLIGKENLVVNE